MDTLDTDALLDTVQSQNTSNKVATAIVLFTVKKRNAEEVEVTATQVMTACNLDL